MAFPPFPSNGEINWGSKMQTWSDAVEGEAGKMRIDRSVGTRVFIDDPSGSVMVHGHTGSRSLRDLFENGWSSFGKETIISREGNIVTYASRVSGTSATANEMLTIPLGFRPYFQFSAVMPLSIGSTITFRTLTGVVESSARQRIEIVTSWYTEDPWPLSLPGYAA